MSKRKNTTVHNIFSSKWAYSDTPTKYEHMLTSEILSPISSELSEITDTEDLLSDYKGGFNATATASPSSPQVANVRPKSDNEASIDEWLIEAATEAEKENKSFILRVKENLSNKKKFTKRRENNLKDFKKQLINKYKDLELTYSTGKGRPLIPDSIANFQKIRDDYKNEQEKAKKDFIKKSRKTCEKENLNDLCSESVVKIIDNKDKQDIKLQLKNNKMIKKMYKEDIKKFKLAEKSALKLLIVYVQKIRSLSDKYEKLDEKEIQKEEDRKRKMEKQKEKKKEEAKKKQKMQEKKKRKAQRRMEDMSFKKKNFSYLEDQLDQLDELDQSEQINIGVINNNLSTLEDFLNKLN